MKNDINDGNLLVAHTYEKELDRIAIALERIAIVLEKQNDGVVIRQPTVHNVLRDEITCEAVRHSL